MFTLSKTITVALTRDSAAFFFLWGFFIAQYGHKQIKVFKIFWVVKR